MRYRAFLVVALLLLPSTARADSDGSYCHGPGFIAWETRLAIGGANHVLHVVRFGRANGIEPTERIVIPEFQVHGMLCGPKRVELVGWTARYRVDLNAPGRPVITTQETSFDPTKTSPPGSFGAGGRAKVIDLEAEGRTGEFELVVSRTSRQVPAGGGIDHHVVARLVQRQIAPNLQIVASRVLMEGIYRETID